MTQASFPRHLSPHNSRFDLQINSSIVITAAFGLYFAGNPVTLSTSARSSRAICPPSLLCQSLLSSPSLHSLHHSSPPELLHSPLDSLLSFPFLSHSSYPPFPHFKHNQGACPNLLPPVVYLAPFDPTTPNHAGPAYDPLGDFAGAAL